ncbi:MFS transporter [Enterococcus sp. DIV0876]|uniref:MFS transporter n=1 Tax=Enterococcus sp. DIV0876 TaxID=2774633 RepID=UPI003D2FDDC1
MNLLLTKKNFRKYFFLLTSSNIADSIYYIVLVTYASSLSNPAFAISLVTLSETLPEVFSPLAGSFADNIKNKYNTLKLLTLLRILFYLIISVLVLNHSMFLLYLMCILNFFSDICGKFFRTLLVPYIPHILTEDEIEEAQGLLGANFQLISILANFFGAILISIFSFSGISLINVSIFFISLFLVFSMRQSFKDFEQSIKIKNDSIQLEAVWSHLVHSLRMLYSGKHFFFLAIQFSFINGILNLLVPIISITLVVNQDLIVTNYSISIALFQGTISLGIILGGIWLIKYLKRIKLIKLMPFIYLSLFSLYFFLIIQNGLAIGSFFLVIGLLIGVVNPKFSHMTLTTFPRELLSTISGSCALLLKVVTIISSLLFSGVSASDDLNSIYSFYIVLVFLGTLSGGISIYLVNRRSETLKGDN